MSLQTIQVIRWPGFAPAQGFGQVRLPRLQHQSREMVCGRTNLATFVDDWRAYSARTAIVSYKGNRRKVTCYGELALLAQRVAAELQRRGLKPEDRVLLWGDNSAEWIAAFFGCVLCGVVVVPLDAAGTSDFAARVTGDVRPRLILGDADLLGKLQTGIPQLELDHLVSILKASDGAKLAPVNLTRASPLQILFTSGTTSEPKGIVHTHGNVLASVEPIEREIAKYRLLVRLFAPLRFLHTLPLSHVFGQFMALWLPPLLTAEVHFESRLEAERIVRRVRRERITVLAAVPRLLDLLRSYLLMQQSGLAERVQQHGQGKPLQRIWRFRNVHQDLGWKFWAFVCGGAALPGDLEQFWSTLGFAVVQGYGMTETAALVTLNHPFKVSRGSIGKALPGREVRIGPEGEISVRGEMISNATWQNGKVVCREDPWLATGDIVASDVGGNLRFVGRKSEVIVNPSGLNIHPEDLEAALRKQPELSACAVVPLALPGGGHEPAAAVVAPGGESAAAAAVLAANRELADFQRLRRWFLWPEADLPRTSIGKVQRRKVRDWIAKQSSGEKPAGAPAGRELDALVALVEAVTGATVTRTDDPARLDEDLHLDSLGRVQLQSAAERRFGVSIDDAVFLRIETLGQLRAAFTKYDGTRPAAADGSRESKPAAATHMAHDADSAVETPVVPRPREFRYPRWPWWPPVAWLRIAFLELVARPLMWLLLLPRVESPAVPLPAEPMLLIANHVAVFDAPLVLYGLPRKVRNRVAVAAAGEMLEDWRHARNQGNRWLNALAPLQYWLATALFNVFPLPRQAGFRRSFAHVGEALDNGYSVLIFPEGRRSPEGMLQPFRSGIGLLAQESHTAVLPVALLGMPELTARKRKWFHAGVAGIRLGSSVRVRDDQPAEEIVTQLHDDLEVLLRQERRWGEA